MKTFLISFLDVAVELNGGQLKGGVYVGKDGPLVYDLSQSFSCKMLKLVDCPIKKSSKFILLNYLDIEKIYYYH